MNDAPQAAAATASAAASTSAAPPWALALPALLAVLGTGEAGLSGDEAHARLRRDGPNAVQRAPQAEGLKLLLRQFASPLVLILLVGAAVSLFLRDWLDATIILVIVAGSAVLGAWQEWRASQAIAALARRLALTARVRRDGALRTVPATDLVRGDVVELAAGNLVPADGVLLAARDLMLSEAPLTGESFPVEKRPGVCAADAAPAARSNSVFLGTSVRSGTGTFVVSATGAATALGDIAAELRLARAPTEFERGVAQFGVLLLRIMVVMVLLVVMLETVQGRSPITSLMYAVALAVGLSPELLPAIVSVTLAHGARAMAATGVLVRRQQAIEDLGSIDVLCTDKTGTLTLGDVQLVAALDAQGQAARTVLELAVLNASLETGIENPLDRALVAAGEREGIVAGAGVHKVDEIPYDFQRRRLTIVVARDGDADHHELVTKGAVDAVLGICTHWRVDAAIELLSDAARAQIGERLRAAGEAGQRMLALASLRTAAKASYERADEQGLCLEGLLLFADPPKPDAAQSLHRLQQRGIHVKMLTGDNRHVAAHVARGVGLRPERLLTGEKIAAMRDEALWQQAARTDVFAEIDPQQKERIVRALQRAGHAVGFLGDGINDAPALHAADVGISVDGATDVARESADVVLLAPSLALLHDGVVQGRRAFANTLKYIGITTSANFGNMLSMAAAGPLLPFLPLAPKQILLNNFLSDLPSMAIATDRVDDEHLRHPQRWSVVEVRRRMIVYGLISSVFDLITFALLLLVFAAGEALFQTAWFVVSVLTELAVVMVLRTRLPAWRSRPSALLVGSTVVVAVVSVALPYTGPLAALLGFVPLPAPLLIASLAIVAAYLVLTEAMKRLFERRYIRRQSAPSRARRR
ncbi:MAG: magnesium-translocating P-type ATPase [Burkholderiaceae bacterium]